MVKTGWLSITSIIQFSITKSDTKFKSGPSGIKIGQEQLSILAYADYIVLIGKNEVETRQLFVEIEDVGRKLGLHINQDKTKCMIVKWKTAQYKIKQDN